IVQLHSTDDATRKAASSALVAMGEEAVPALLEVTRSPKFVARMRAIEALGEIGSRWAFWPLVDLPLAEQDDDLLVARIHALVAITERLAEAPTLDDLPWLVMIFKEFRFDVNHRGVAIAAAQGFLRLAQTAPGPALLPTLPLFCGNLIRVVPEECTQIQKQLKTLLAAWKDLPIPAQSLPDTRNLPLPYQDIRESDV
ncbi:HEAT repeat domain-containing protein, partial [Armatimonas sp.]|uniref:HEAT repeat domain-containing protein n=1 Tax=Armatimonas sp. TaxID=1872638 RepID=UPI00286A9AFF